MVVEKQLANAKVPQFQLFNLAEDPAEKTNVIDEVFRSNWGQLLYNPVNGGRARY